ncbi:MAG TPA: ubiquinone biosynthesis protein [Telluria sp.]|nr:ubiquinone biosynthesis protein [Telluria sp.]
MHLWQLLSSFPSAVPTVLLAVLLIYWLISIAGVLDMGDALDLDTDAGHAAHDAHDPADLHSVAGYLVALGLGGVPLSVAASALVFFTWLITALLHQYLLAWLPAGLARAAGGVVVLLLAAALAIPLSARVLTPLRGLFVQHGARRNASLVGLECAITTEQVTRRFGRAAVADHGASIQIRVWAEEPNALSRRARAVIIGYDARTGHYEVQAIPESV